MAEKVEVQPESLLNLEELLQCPVCYEIPASQIYQCNEGHHVCGRCKVRLDVCPVCRALFFGTRNYAMEELIACVRKVKGVKLGSKTNTGSGSPESSTPAQDPRLGESENDTAEDEDNNPDVSNQTTLRPPQACKGLFRCLCCKNGQAERLPSARLLNHLRYFHSPDLIEGRSENGEYLQAWQFSTVPGRIVTAVRVADMGIFFLVIEISTDSLCAWLTMAASPWVAHEFCYTVTISGNDREAIFSDRVWSVRSCEGSLKKRGNCLLVNGLDARALVAPVAISGKLSVRRTPAESLAHQTQPRAVLRVASRGNTQENGIRDIQDRLERLSRIFVTVNMFEPRVEVNQMRNENTANNTISEDHNTSAINSESLETPVNNEAEAMYNVLPLSRNARRRMRQRLREALGESQPLLVQSSSPVPPSQINGRVPVLQRQSDDNLNNEIHQQSSSVTTQHALPVLPPSEHEPTSGPSNGISQSRSQPNANKKRRRHRR